VDGSRCDAARRRRKDGGNATGIALTCEVLAGTKEEVLEITMLGQNVCRCIEMERRQAIEFLQGEKASSIR